MQWIMYGGLVVAVLIAVVVLGFAVVEVFGWWREAWAKRKWVQERQYILNHLSTVDRYMASYPQVVETVAYIRGHIEILGPGPVENPPLLIEPWREQFWHRHGAPGTSAQG